MRQSSTPNHASPVDLDTPGHHRPGGRPGPRHPFRGRIGTTAFPAEPGRYHLYVAAVCPYAQRLTNLWAYARDLDAHPALRENTDFTVISHRHGETDTSCLRVEPQYADWDEPHRRAAL